MGTYNWTGTAGDGLWSDLNNWSPNNGPPGGADTADILGDGFSVAVSGGISGVGDLDLGLFFGSPTGSTVSVDNGGTLDVEGSSTVVRASTLQSEPGGSIDLLFSGTLTNGGTILVGQDFNGGGGSSTLNINGAVTLSGSGTLELGEVSVNPFAQKSTGNIANAPSTSDTLVNQGNTIVGDGSIVIGTFDNQAAGTVKAGLSGSGALSIAAITFSNEGNMVAATGATLNLGLDNTSASLTNTGTVILDNNSTLAIAGDYTISGVGNIQMEPETEQTQVTPGQIVSDGNPAELILVNQTFKGAGTIGDANLTLLNAGGTIAADVPGQALLLKTGNNAITNGGTLAAINSGILGIGSPIGNSGTIEANGGIVEIGAALSVPSVPPGQHSTIDIGANGVIELGSLSNGTFSGVSAAGNVTFTSGSAELALDANLPNGGIGGDIVGAVTSDVIIFANVPFSSSLQTSWLQNGSTGTLSLIDGGLIVASVKLAGQYTNSDFRADTNFDGAVDVVNPNPPPATTADMIMQEGGTGDFEFFDLGSNAIQASGVLGQPLAIESFEAAEEGATAGPNWQVAGLGDFGGDTSDMLLRNSSTGAFEVWDIANNNITGSASMGQVGLEWTVAGFGDFSGNANETDMLMRNSNTGAFEIYDIANNAIYNAASMGAVGPEWSVAGFGDFSTRPNETDMLMRNTNTGVFELYDISNNQLASAVSIGAVGPEWSVAGFGDFSGNANETDMLMRNTNTGEFEIYDFSNNQLASAGSIGAVGLEWSVAGFGAIDGAGSSDMLMRNVNTGAFEVYDIANNTLGGSTSMGGVGLSWSVAGIAADPPSAPPSQLAQSMASYAAGDSASGVASPLQAMMPETTTSPLAAHS